MKTYVSITINGKFDGLYSVEWGNNAYSKLVKLSEEKDNIISQSAILSDMFYNSLNTLKCEAERVDRSEVEFVSNLVKLNFKL